jgi:hypothetical protein
MLNWLVKKRAGINRLLKRQRGNQATGNIERHQKAINFKPLAVNQYNHFQITVIRLFTKLKSR